MVVQDLAVYLPPVVVQQIAAAPEDTLTEAMAMDMRYVGMAGMPVITMIVMIVTEVMGAIELFIMMIVIAIMEMDIMGAIVVDIMGAIEEGIIKAICLKE